MRVLIGCETSGVMRRAFAARGHDAWSVDLLPDEDGSNHHVLGGDCEVLERVDVPSGARILYAIVKEPTRLFQDAAVPFEHGTMMSAIRECDRLAALNPGERYVVVGQCYEAFVAPVPAEVSDAL